MSLRSFAEYMYIHMILKTIDSIIEYIPDSYMKILLLTRGKSQNK